MDMISALPNEILHRILDFLPEKEAARTSVLSKSWSHIWRTRPNLALSDTMNFFKGNKKQEFPYILDKTLLRYCDQRLRLEKFRLHVSLLGRGNSDQESILVLKKWIPLLTNMGVKEFYFSISAEHNVEEIVDLLLVVFRAESLNLLYLHNCNLGQINPDCIIPIPPHRLQVLHLYEVIITDEIFDKIISSCPLLTNLFVKYCKDLENIKLEKKLHKYLKHFTFIGTRECIIEVDIPTLELFEILGCKIRFPSHTKFSNLRTFSLDGVEISSNLIEQSQICIDAPNLEYFHYGGFGGSFIPSISFVPACRESSLKLYIMDDVEDAQSWFLRLSNLLQALPRADISLSICHRITNNNLHIQEDVFNGGNKPVVVEHLELSFFYASLLPSFLNGLFCVCRPRSITPKWLWSRGNWAEIEERESKLEELGEFICTIQKMRESGNQEIWQYLEDLNVDGFDECLQEWEALEVSNLSKSDLPDYDSFRVQLQWRDQDCDSTSKLLESSTANHFYVTFLRQMLLVSSCLGRLFTRRALISPVCMLSLIFFHYVVFCYFIV